MVKMKWFKPLVLGTFALMLAACGSDAGTTNKGAGNAGTASPANTAAPTEVVKEGLKNDTTPIKIQYWHSHAEAQLPGLDAMLESFHAKYSHITIEPVYQGGYPDLHKKLQAAVAAKDVPAVTNVEVASLPNFADSGVFAELTSWINRDKVDTADFAQGMLNAYAFNGKQFGFPLIVSTSVFVYNKTLLDELGVQPPQTWDEIEAFNEKVTLKEGDKTVRYAMSIPGWDTWYYDPWNINGGGQILNDAGEAAVATEASMRYMNNFHKWLQDGSLHMGYGTGASNNMRQMFLNGEIAMVQHTSANLKMYRENANFEVGVSFIPGDVNRISNIGGAGIAIMEGASELEKEAAWKFVEHMTASENNIAWAEAVGYLPTRKSALESAEGAAYFERWPQYKAVFDNFDSVTPRLQHPAYTEFSSLYKEVVGEMILNNVDPATLMPGTADKMNDVIVDYE